MINPISNRALSILRIHDIGIALLIPISVFVTIIVVLVLTQKFGYRSFLGRERLEIMWLVLPFIILIAYTTPSLKMLFINSGNRCFSDFLNITGRQWYWQYQLNSDETIDSYIRGRNIDVDYRPIIPRDAALYVTRGDVLHSYAIPSLRVKIDAVPGRINFRPLNGALEGVYYGQCSELCGVNHRFMPCSLLVV